MQNDSPLSPIVSTLPRAWEQEQTFNDSLYEWMSRAPWLLVSAAFHFVIALVIAAILACTAVALAYETKSLLTGEAARGSTVAALNRMALAEPAVRAVNELRTLHFGPNDILAVLSLDFADSSSLADIEATVARLERAIKHRFPKVTRVFIEVQAAEHHAADLQAAVPSAE